MTAGLGPVLLAALAMAIADIVHIGGGVAFIPADLALWALVALPLGLGVGLILGAGNATWGEGWLLGLFRRLRRDRDLDANVAATLVAAALVAGVLALAVDILANKLVIQAHRQATGALLLGVVVVALLPILALGVLPLFRVLRRVTALVPAIGPLSRVVILLVGAAVATVLAGAYVITSGYDYQSTNLGAPITIALLPVIALVLSILGHGALARVRERIPRRGTIVAAGAIVAAALPMALLVTPSEDTRIAIEDRSYFGAPAIKLLRSLIDMDGDGESAFFGGPDCDDHDPTIYSGADDIPGDGIDQNCSGEDAKLTVEDAPPPDAPAPGGDAPPPAPPLSGGDNVLVIFVDTLRYDRLGVSGYKREGASLTPRIDAFAAQSVVFEQAYSQAPNTPRSAPSFLSSHYPSQVKYDRKTRDYPKISDDNELLFESMQGAGFHTLGMSSHFYFCDRPRYPKSCAGVAEWLDSNIGQGVDVWDNDAAGNIPESNSDIAGPRIVKKTVAKLDELAKTPDKKFAMLVHLFEPHSDYPFHKKFTYKDRSLAERYDYEVALEDEFVGEILDALDRTGLAKTTTVVLLSDHGEAFGVHVFAGQEMFFHGQTLYRELIHVPLIFRVPGAKPQMRSDVVQLVDLAPTVAALFGVTPPKSWQGRSLVPALEGKPIAPRAAYSELLWADNWRHEGKSMVSADGRYHVFYRMSDNRWEVYDLSVDPEERKRLDNEEPAAKEMRKKLLDWMEGPLRAGVLK
ncbi:MAG: sulfatase-like hydrolase/transferase [Deltaproteobacteria bacterium]|nr:sulfatase-like hydrolase/transferase [Deltaproteobacteria bacterium]